MINTFELGKVLEAVDGGREIEYLVDFHIPYAKALHYLRFALNAGMLKLENEVLQLTDAGRAELARPPMVRTTGARVPDRFDIARVPPLDPEAVHSPKKVVG